MAEVKGGVPGTTEWPWEKKKAMTFPSGNPAGQLTVGPSAAL